MQISCKGSVDTRSSGVDTMLQTQEKIMQNWSSSVDTSSDGVDTRDSLQKTFWPIWDSSVDTRDSLQKTFWPIWDSVSTLDQLVSTLVALPKKYIYQVEPENMYHAVIHFPFL
ncbi:hypothetical protein Taro_054500 [Colocasia esculenta]|uniref:Uncharacterized protein n=1 Tax=Colocasia esculenta TaxID=4460 RepID=A0A843XNN7_COLES|nr:hypothetical protein [Colocasia esculenta]